MASSLRSEYDLEPWYYFLEPCNFRFYKKINKYLVCSSYLYFYFSLFLSLVHINDYHYAVVHSTQNVGTRFIFAILRIK